MKSFFFRIFLVLIFLPLVMGIITEGVAREGWAMLRMTWLAVSLNVGQWWTAFKSGDPKEMLRDAD